MLRSMTPKTPHIVVIGAGFAGIAACQALRNSAVKVSLVDRQNHHVFQPLLYQVATAALSPADIAHPIRSIFRKQENLRVYLGEAVKVDLAGKSVEFHGGSTSFDYLILAAGATHSYFGRDDWNAEAPGLKSIDDATEIRKRILLAFEEAEYEGDLESRRAKLTFVIVGGGPTGVELAGAMKEIAADTIVDDFRNIDTSTARIILVQAGDRLLPSFHEKLSASALRDLEQMGVEVRLNSRVTGVDEKGVKIGEEFLPAQNIFWAAGVKASPLGGTLGVPIDKSGRVLVAPDFSVPGSPNVFVLGDMAALNDPVTGNPVPGVAPAATQAGQFVGRLLAREVNQTEPSPRPTFRYFDKGSMATIGKAKAIAEIRGLRFRGFIAWCLWCFVHVAFLISFRSRIVVMLSWTWNYLLSTRGARLITGKNMLSIKQFRETFPRETKTQ